MHVAKLMFDRNLSFIYSMHDMQYFFINHTHCQCLFLDKLHIAFSCSQPIYVILKIGHFCKCTRICELTLANASKGFIYSRFQVSEFFASIPVFNPNESCKDDEGLPLEPISCSGILSGNCTMHASILHFLFVKISPYTLCLLDLHLRN